MPGRIVCARSLSVDSHPNVACNSPGSVFNTAYKRCNSNDAISMFEIIARELHATLLRNHRTTTAGIWRVPGRVVYARPLSGVPPKKVACNSPGSVFNTAYKRCNSNDAISMFEIVARELHATLLRNHRIGTKTGTKTRTKTGTKTRTRTETSAGGARRLAGTPGAHKQAAYQAITRPLRRHAHAPARPSRHAATAR